MNLIEKSFSKYTRSYDAHAKAQEIGARLLCMEIEKNFVLDEFKNRNILEIGCGTGILSRHLNEIFKKSNLFFSDISQEMTVHCKKSIEDKKNNKKFFVQDGETFYKKETFSLIFSSFTIQWFKNYIKALENYYDSLEKNGSMLISFQGPESFPEWKKISKELNLSFTGNLMPDPKEIEKFAKDKFKKYSLINKKIKLEYRSSLEFFNSLKYIGASIKTRDQAYSQGEFLKLVKYWNKTSKNKIESTYSVWFLTGYK